MIPAVLFSAGVIITGKIAILHYDPFTIIFLRFLTATLIFIPFVIKDYHSFKIKDLIMLIPTGIIGFFFYNFMIVNALKTTSASNLSIISALVPLTTLILERLFFKTYILKNQFLALALGILSIIIAIIKGQLLNLFNITWAKGDLYMLFGVLCISTYSIINSRIKHSYPLLQILMFYFLITTVLSAPFAINEWPLKFVWSGVLAIVYQGILGTALTYLFIQISLKKFGTNRTMIYFNLIPITALFLSIIILKEELTTPLVISGILMFLSVKLSINE